MSYVKLYIDFVFDVVHKNKIKSRKKEKKPHSNQNE